MHSEFLVNCPMSVPFLKKEKRVSSQPLDAQEHVLVTLKFLVLLDEPREKVRSCRFRLSLWHVSQEEHHLHLETCREDAQNLQQ